MVKARCLDISGKLKRADIIHDVAEGASRRYRVRDDSPDTWATTWSTVAGLSTDDPEIVADRQRLEVLRTSRGQSWVERVAGCLDREYAPGRTWEPIAHGFLQLIKTGVVLDVGAGDGAMINLLAPRCRELICLDPSSHMIAAGETRISEAGVTNVRYLEGDGEHMPVANDSCDLVLFLQSLQYIADPAAALAEAGRVLAPGGTLLVLTLASHDHQEALRYGHRHFGFEPHTLTEWCAGLDDVTCYSLTPEARPPRFQPLVLSARRSC